MVKNILFICVFYMFSLLANESMGQSASSRLETSSIVQVVIEQADSIEFLDDGRLYLKPENIYTYKCGPNTLQWVFNNFSPAAIL